MLEAGVHRPCRCRAIHDGPLLLIVDRTGYAQDSPEPTVGGDMTGSGRRSLPRYVLIDDGNFLRLRWADGVTIESADVHSTIAAVTAASPRGKRPLLVHIGPVERITAEAKQMLIDDTCSTRTAVLGADEVSRVITAFNQRSATPSRYFIEESEAIAWLTEDTPLCGFRSQQTSFPNAHNDPTTIPG